MRIGITCYPTYGGSGVVATELGIELAERGHEIHFISYSMPIRLSDLPCDKDCSGRISYHEVEVVRYPLFDYPPYALALATKMTEVVEHYNLDLLHVHYAIPHSVSAYLAQAMLAPRKLPVVTTLHGTDITLVGQDRSFLPITRFAIEQSNGVTAVSQYLKQETHTKFSTQKSIEVIPNFVNCDRYQRVDNADIRAQYAPNGEVILGHLSNFRPVKRVDNVIEVFDRVRKEMPARLLLIGDGPERNNAEYLVRDKNLQEDVIFVGKQTSVADMLSACNLFLLPSQSESFGLAALEALACEVPVVASNVGGLPEVITHGEDGYLVDPDNVEEMANRSLEILCTPERNRAMGQQARKNAQKRYCSTKIIPKYEAFYQKMVSAK